MKKWIDVTFESSCYLTDQYRSFDRELKKYIKTRLPEGYTIINWLRSHFESSAMIVRPDAQIIYISISDVRHFKNAWYNNILYRTAKHNQDWTGGSNNYSDLDNLIRNISELEKEEV